MKLILDERIIREVIDTLYMARSILLGITELDSPQEVAKKCANETAITRRIGDAIDIIQQSEQPKVELEDEIHTRAIKLHTAPCYDELRDFAIHFYKLGRLDARKEETK